MHNAPADAAKFLRALLLVFVLVCTCAGCAEEHQTTAGIIGKEPPKGFNPYARRDPVTGEVIAPPEDQVVPWGDPLAGVDVAPELPAGFSGPNAAGAGVDLGLGLGLADDSKLPPPAASDRPAPAVRPGASAWTIVLITFRGEGAAIAGEEALARVRGSGLIDGVFMEARGESVVLARGAYESYDTPAAQRDLQQLRELTIEGERPFAGAVLAPPSDAALAGRIPMLDLRQARANYGRDAIYTLQVGVYGQSDGGRPPEGELAEYRAAAERAAYDLRREGELAFYYHAPNRSMVTVGLFGIDDFDPQNKPGFESPRLRQTKERNPLNLLNGQGIRQRVRKQDGSEEWDMQRSGLVAVPD